MFNNTDCSQPASAPEALENSPEWGGTAELFPRAQEENNSHIDEESLQTPNKSCKTHNINTDCTASARNLARPGSRVQNTQGSLSYYGALDFMADLSMLQLSKPPREPLTDSPGQRRWKEGQQLTSNSSIILRIPLPFWPMM